MRLPLSIAVFAVVTAAIMAYGVHPGLAHHARGLDAIMLARRLQWPLIALSMVACVALLGMVISGKRRAWWLIALAPVLTLFVHRFLTRPINRYLIADDPMLVTPGEMGLLQENDKIVGVIFNDRAYAYPSTTLARFPVVVQTDREHRMLLLWSPKAEAVSALRVSRDFKARDLSITSEPHGGLLIYNSRRGQFILARTGLTPSGEKPANVIAPLSAAKTTWGAWKTSHPQTLIMFPG